LSGRDDELAARDGASSAMPRQALVLAAGKSTRIEALAEGRPKPLLPVGGEAIIARNLRWLGQEGVTRLFVNLHHRPEALQAFVGDGARFGVEVSWSLEPELLGTAGAAKKLEAEWGGAAFFVIYGDNVLSTDLSRLWAAHLRARTQGALATVALFDRARHPHTGIAGGRVRLDSAQRITAFAEGAGDDVSSLVNAGVYAVESELLEWIRPGAFADFGRDVFPALLAADRPLFGEFVTEYCLGIDTPESYQRAQALALEGRVRLR
jgi:mannose-1-phosphate guanylyltransferase